MWVRACVRLWVPVHVGATTWESCNNSALAVLVATQAFLIRSAVASYSSPDLIAKLIKTLATSHFPGVDGLWSDVGFL